MRAGVIASALLWASAAGAGILDCVPPQPVDLAVRIGSAEPARLQLTGGQGPALRLQDPQTGVVYWSASSTAPATQLFAEMWAGFAGSLTAVDLDGDGLHDRVYAGDLAGRLWRFDIHQGATPATLFTGGIFASLGGTPALRAFLAPPDVSLPAAVGAAWLNIAIGTASLVPGPERNRFYVLRDPSPFEPWAQEDYDHWRPLTEPDLQWMNDPERAATAADGEAGSNAGFYVTLASGSVLTSSITVSGHAVIAIAQQANSAGPQCRVAVTISSLSLHDGKPALDLNRDGVVDATDHTLSLSAQVPASAAFLMVTEPGETTTTCRLGDAVISGCSVSTRLTPLWWRREDAD